MVEAWIETKHQLPSKGRPVLTKIDDGHGYRNEQVLIWKNDLWWYPDMSMYVYYQPTHWAYPS